MPNVMVALPNIGGTLCATPQSLADAHYWTALYSSGCQPNFAALHRGRHLYSTRRPSRWALAHISSALYFVVAALYACGDMSFTIFIDHAVNEVEHNVVADIS